MCPTDLCGWWSASHPTGLQPAVWEGLDPLGPPLEDELKVWEFMLNYDVEREWRLFAVAERVGAYKDIGVDVEWRSGIMW
jgi:hypothetical protein